MSLPRPLAVYDRGPRSPRPTASTSDGHPGAPLRRASADPVDAALTTPQARGHSSRGGHRGVLPSRHKD